MQKSHSLSAPVVSSQVDPHRNLQRKLLRYERSSFVNSIPNYARDEFLLIKEVIRQRKVILDSGCGTGESSFKLAELFPDNLVIGIDKSAHRLQRRHMHGKLPKNLIFVRCDLVHFWQLLSDAPWQLTAHYLLYPNPWPKPGHLIRRWHAHPIFPMVIKLGGMLIMRTNWRVYAQEFALALQHYLNVAVSIKQLTISEPLSAFERKYWQSGHELFAVEFNLSTYQKAGPPILPATLRAPHYA